MRVAILGCVVACVLGAPCAFTQAAEALRAVDVSDAVLGDDPGPPAQLWCVQVSGLVTSVDVADCARQLGERGLQRVVSSPGGVVRTVQAGTFEFAADAALCAEDLRQRGFHSVTVEPIEVNAETLPLMTRRLPLEPVFRLEADNIAQTASPDIDMDSDPVIQEMRAAEALRNAEGDAQLEQLAASLPETDPRRARVTLTLAHRYNWRSDWEEALALYRAVADGSTPVRHHDRTNAMINVGWLYEYRIGDRRAAYQANRELELFTDDPVVRARARTEQAWVMFEMVRYDDIGTWDDVRRLCAATYADTDPNGSAEMQQWRAVARLIHLETYHYEERYEEVVRYAQAYLDEYGQEEARRREVGMDRAWLGIAHMRLGHTEEARRVFRELAEMNLQPEENFGGENMDVLAATYSFEIAAREGNVEEMRFWAAYLQQNHPDRPETGTVARRLARLLGRSE